MRKTHSYFEFIDEAVRNKPVILTLSNWIYIEVYVEEYQKVKCASENQIILYFLEKSYKNNDVLIS